MIQTLRAHLRMSVPHVRLSLRAHSNSAHFRDSDSIRIPYVQIQSIQTLSSPHTYIQKPCRLRSLRYMHTPPRRSARWTCRRQLYIYMPFMSASRSLKAFLAASMSMFVHVDVTYSAQPFMLAHATPNSTGIAQVAGRSLSHVELMRRAPFEERSTTAPAPLVTRTVQKMIDPAGSPFAAWVLVAELDRHGTS